MARLSVFEERQMGSEPVITSKSSRIELIRAYSWYNYFNDADEAKKYCIAYLKHTKAASNDIKKINQIDAINLINLGWNCKILLNGGSLPQEVDQQFHDKLKTLLKNTKLKIEKVNESKQTNVASIQDHIQNKANELIGELEEQIDIFITQGKNDFDCSAWFRAKAIKPVFAKKIAEYYKPLYEQVYDAIQAKDNDLVEYYKGWKKTKLKHYLEFLKSIISCASINIESVKHTRKPRKKKVKPAAVLAAKVKYKQEDKELGLKSLEPREVVGAQQVWLYNTKYRTITVLNAVNIAGFSIKGTSVVAYDEKSSITKRLRKPKEQLKSVLEGGKITLKKFMSTVKSKEKQGKGRINNETIILRAIK